MKNGSGGMVDTPLPFPSRSPCKDPASASLLIYNQSVQVGKAPRPEFSKFFLEVWELFFTLVG